MRILGISKGFLKRLFLLMGAAAIIAGLCAFDAFCIEPYFPRVIRQEVHIKGLPKSLEGLKIVHMSDLHIVKLGKREERAIRLIKKVKPDLICLTGDYVEDDGITPGEHTTAECVEEAARFVSQLRAKYGVFAVTGNWDPMNMPEFERAGARMVDTEAVTLNIKDSRLIITSAYAIETRNVLKSTPRAPTIVLDHIPDSADTLERTNAKVDLVLSGHWHGGQVSWPFFGPFDKKTMRYPAGLYKIGHIQLYVTRGLGMHSHAIRFNCPAEVTLITLRRG